jgi:hypothetical protein
VKYCIAGILILATPALAQTLPMNGPVNMQAVGASLIKQLGEQATQRAFSDADYEQKLNSCKQQLVELQVKAVGKPEAPVIPPPPITEPRPGPPPHPADWPKAP